MYKIAVFNAQTGETTYEEIGEELPAFSSEQLFAHRENKMKEISTMTESAIMTPYQSSIVLASTGIAHVYGVDRDDQRNMDSKLTILFGVPSITEQYWKTKYDGVILHTRDEFINVVLEIATHIEQTIFKGVLLKERLEAATTQEEMDAIRW